jgi:hypothetical protein
VPLSPSRHHRRVGVRAVAAAVLSVLLIAVGQGDAPAKSTFAIDQIAEVDPQIAARLRQFEPFLRPTTARPPVPADPVPALVAETNRFAGALGFIQDAGPRIRAANLPPDVAGRLALLVQDLNACDAITAKYRAALFRQLPALFRDRSGLHASDYPEVLPCAIRVWRSTQLLESALRAALPPTRDGACRALDAGAIDVWPVLRFEPSCAATVYRDDYLLSVDVGGDDTYNNNVGSNVIDINYSPPGAAVPGLKGIGPALGCQRGLAGLGSNECYLSAAVLLDLQGADTYGVLEEPDHDLLCTHDRVVRRMLTGGSGFLGVGILRDAANSDDHYNGKTISLGAGHLYGVGILSDVGGNDRYLAVRNSEGFSLLGGLGLLHDEGGDDSYGYYIPAPINPNATNQTDGAGGVRDNEGNGYCDRVPRYTLGGANLLSSATGMLIDDSGDDSYHGAFADLYTTNPSIPGMLTTGGSLGFGGNEGLAVFFDRAGHDTYRVDRLPAGVPARGDGVVVRPGTAATDAWGTGLFIDR